MAEKKTTNIQTYKKKPHFNIGIAVFGIIFIYLAATIFMYMTEAHITAYEVREGSILKDTAYTGLALRNETVITSEGSGYINYFCQENSKVGAKTDVYTLSSDQLDFRETSSEDSQSLTSEELDALLLKAQSFSEDFDEQQFRDVYTLKESVQSVLESKSSQSRQSQLDEMLKEKGDSLKIYKAASDGIISYALDGYEKVKPTDVTEQMLSKSDYSVTSITNNTKVNNGDDIYKLVTDDTWTIVISLDKNTAEEMSDTERVKVHFSKDDESERANFEILRKGDSCYGILKFDTAMIRYVQERYLDIELILEDESGLKIPRSSVVNKEFYTIPSDYLTQGGNSKATGILIENDRESTVFQTAEIYYWDQKTDMVYLDPLDFEEGTVVVKPESSETHTLKETKSLKGVYNINKGYAVFKQIEILCESDEYYIVKSGSDYGLANYDHIALDGSLVSENDVIF